MGAGLPVHDLMGLRSHEPATSSLSSRLELVPVPRLRLPESLRLQPRLPALRTSTRIKHKLRFHDHFCVHGSIKVPHDAVLPSAVGLGGPSSCLNSARYVDTQHQPFLLLRTMFADSPLHTLRRLGISFGMMGALKDCLYRACSSASSSGVHSHRSSSCNASPPRRI